MTIKTPPVGNETRKATVAASSVNREARTASLIWTTGARVKRSSWSEGVFFEELSLDPKHVRLDRLASGRAPLLASHAPTIDAVIGVIESVRLEKGEGTATVRFAAAGISADADRIFGLVADGILTSVSVGYRVDKFVKVEGGDGTTPTFRAEDWTPYEISIVAMPADVGSFVRSSPTTKQEHPMEPKIDEMQAERERTRGILSAVRTAKFDSSFAEKLIKDNVSLSDARAAVLEEMAKRSDAIKTDQHGVEGHERYAALPGSGDIGHGGVDTRILAMSEALAARMTGAPKISDDARQYLQLSPVDMARHLLEVRGVSTRFMSKNQIIQRAQAGTSDFPSLLTETGNRILRNEYQAFAGGIKAICRKGVISDFRAKSMLQISAAGELPIVPESAEFTNFPLSEAKNSYSIATYGGIFSISRQALVNDDTGAFSEMARKLGRASANTLASLLAQKLTSNPNMPDGTALFHANHGNLAGVGTVISVASLGVAIKAMRLQTDLDGKTLIDVRPKFLVVPAALETVALQTMTAINANQASNVNPYAGQLSVVVDPRLDANSVTAWYLAADPSAIDTIEFVEGLDGAEGPEVTIEQGFRVDGTSWRVRFDAGAGVIDHRGLYKNPGA